MINETQVKSKNKVLLFNPRATNFKARIPNSILQVAASIEETHEWIIVDGNLEADPLATILDYLRQGNFGYFGCTVMPGPQLRQAVPITRAIRTQFPSIINIWGGYFPANHPDVVLQSGMVDFIINGPGDHAFPQLLQAMDQEHSYAGISNLIYFDGMEVVKTAKAPLLRYDDLPSLPYDQLNSFYPLSRYLGKSFMGNHTIAYHSSFGCPFKCSFCAVVPIYEARWNGKSADKIYADIKYLKENYGGDAIEFHDNNFFVSEKRTVAFSKLIKGENMQWWGEARIDTVDKYSDESLALMREAGCRMIFFGAESGNDDLLDFMDKGGKQTGQQILNFAKRIRRFDIIPEYSFVLGWPAASEAEALQQVEAEINFIRQVKDANPDTEIIIYVYSPVPTEGSEMFEKVKAQGFRFPQRLEDWLAPDWESFDLRKNPLTPWLSARVIDKVRNFETVLNAYYPTVSDIKLSSFQRKSISGLASLRYRMGLYNYPYELKALQRFWLKYRQPEKEGF